jgi:hypothetical protein
MEETTTEDVTASPNGEAVERDDLLSSRIRELEKCLEAVIAHCGHGHIYTMGSINVFTPKINVVTYNRWVTVLRDNSVY